MHAMIRHFPSFERLEGKLPLAGNLTDGPAIDLVYDQTDGSLAIRPEGPTKLFAIELLLTDGNLLTKLPDGPAPFERFLTRTFDDLVWVSLTPILVEGELGLDTFLATGIESNEALQAIFSEVRYVDDSGGSPEFDLVVKQPGPAKLQLTINVDPTTEVTTFPTVALGDPSPSIELVISNQGESSMTVSAFSDSPAFVIAAPSQGIAVAPATSHAFSVRLDTSRVGLQQGTISIFHERDPELENPLELKFQGTVTSVLYLAFDGFDIGGDQLRVWATDWGTSPDLIDEDGKGINVEPFDNTSPNREELISRVIDYVNQALSPFALRARRLVGRELVMGQGATTVFVGPSDVDGGPHVAGDAADVGNDNATDIAFVGEEDWGDIDRTALATANVILHEAGHSFGLHHVAPFRDELGREEVMGSGSRYPLAAAAFLDEPLPLRGRAGTQNSFDEMVRLFKASGGGVFIGRPLKLYGDIDGDQRVGFSDFLILSANFGKEENVVPSDGDLNLDGVVSFADFLILSDDFGQELTFFPYG